MRWCKAVICYICRIFDFFVHFVHRFQKEFRLIKRWSETKKCNLKKISLVDIKTIQYAKHSLWLNSTNWTLTFCFVFLSFHCNLLCSSIRFWRYHWCRPRKCWTHTMPDMFAHLWPGHIRQTCCNMRKNAYSKANAVRFISTTAWRHRTRNVFTIKLWTHFKTKNFQTVSNWYEIYIQIGMHWTFDGLFLLKLYWSKQLFRFSVCLHCIDFERWFIIKIGTSPFDTN